MSPCWPWITQSHSFYIIPLQRPDLKHWQSISCCRCVLTGWGPQAVCLLHCTESWNYQCLRQSAQDTFGKRNQPNTLQQKDKALLIEMGSGCNAGLLISVWHCRKQCVHFNPASSMGNGAVRVTADTFCLAGTQPFRNQSPFLSSLSRLILILSIYPEVTGTSKLHQELCPVANSGDVAVTAGPEAWISMNRRYLKSSLLSYVQVRWCTVTMKIFQAAASQAHRLEHQTKMLFIAEVRLRLCRPILEPGRCRKVPVPELMVQDFRLQYLLSDGSCQKMALPRWWDLRGVTGNNTQWQKDFLLNVFE